MSAQLHGLRTVIYPTENLQASREWWGHFLGFEPYFNEPFYVGFNVGGYELGLLPDANVADGAQVYWGVDNVDEAVRSAVEHGAVPVSPPTNVGDDIVTATVRIPDGSLVGYISNPHFSIQ